MGYFVRNPLRKDAHDYDSGEEYWIGPFDAATEAEAHAKLLGATIPVIASEGSDISDPAGPFVVECIEYDVASNGIFGPYDTYAEADAAVKRYDWRYRIVSIHKLAGA